MRLLDTISFGAKPSLGTASTKISGTTPGTVFQDVLQKENNVVSLSEKSGEDSGGDNQINQLIKELESWLAGKGSNPLTEENLNALQSLEDLTATPETLSLVDQLLSKIKMLLESNTETSMNSTIEDSEVVLTDEDMETDDLQLTDVATLSQLQHLLFAIMQENQPTQKSSQIAELYEQAPEFLSMLVKTGSEPMANELKRQLFTKDPNQSQLLSMSNAELKSLKSLIEQMMKDSSQTDQKEWKMVESQLKAFLMSNKSDVSVTETPFSLLFKGKEIQVERKSEPIHSLGMIQQQRTGDTFLQGLKLTSEVPAAPQKDLTDQILGSWKQMKFTPFGKSTGSFTIRLNPENLGFITIKLVKQHGMFSSKIIASTESAKELLEHNLSQLKQALPNMSVQIDRFSVSHQNGDQPFGQFADQQKNQQQAKHDQPQHQENEDFREFLDELIETRLQDTEEES
ncbi:flagellar hook-length control protein FliK [Bacillus sp. CLL-7-23]|uniref:Flagellar hook-length control protein FliK n=1 Tax=Bacillus changyiensis TaxID=3004103 RepID=A0ABT4X0N6_9BACI|nr:flagellar hook-length control protein FliK [Bacillus changyiensis]MDA7025860.1 flagellar hook-length control protein FliK [Bacillus changyiensis]